MRPTPADSVLVALAVFAIGVAALRTWTPAPAAAFVEISSGGQTVARYALDRERTISIAGARGESRLQVREGGARFLTSPCRDHLCVNRGWLTHAGESATCERNEVAIVMLGAEEPGAAGP